MRSSNQKNSKFENVDEPLSKDKQFERNKATEPYRSYFFRNHKEVTEPSPSQSSQTNKLSKTKSRLKSTRVKSKNGNCIYYQLESTKKKQDQALRQENVELKQMIAQLKISQLYQIDEKKLRNLLMEIDNLKEELKKLRKENEALRIENDFLNRTNFQLKLEASRHTKKTQADEPSQSFSKDFKNLRLEHQNVRTVSPLRHGQIPTHLLLPNRNPKFSIKTSEQLLKTSLNFNEYEQLQPYSTLKPQKLESLSRVHSQRDLNTNTYNQSRKSHRTAMFTEVQNNDSPFQ